MGSQIDEPARVNHGYLVHTLDRGEPVGDHDHRAFLGQVADGLLDQAFGMAVGLRRRLVEDQDEGCGQEARAIVRRCASPPEKWAPSPMIVS